MKTIVFETAEELAEFVKGFEVPEDKTLVYSYYSLRPHLETKKRTELLTKRVTCTMTGR